MRHEMRYHVLKRVAAIGRWSSIGAWANKDDVVQTVAEGDLIRPETAPWAGAPQPHDDLGDLAGAVGHEKVLNAELGCLPAAWTADHQSPAREVSKVAAHDGRQAFPVADVVPHGPSPARYGEHIANTVGHRQCESRAPSATFTGTDRDIYRKPGAIFTRQSAISTGGDQNLKSNSFSGLESYPAIFTGSL